MARVSLILFLLLTLFVSAHSTRGYCELMASQLTLYTSNSELQQISLSNSIQGYDLSFSSSDQKVADIFEPYHFSEEVNNTLPEGFEIISVDQRTSQEHLFSRLGAIIGFDGNKSIGVAYAIYKNDLLPNISNYSYYKVPQQSDCFNGRVANDNLDVVVDCQSKKQELDYTCLISFNGTISCRESERITHSKYRKAVILDLGEDKKFLVTATLFNYISKQFKNQNYLTIYNLANGVQFNMIIDSRKLNLSTLQINDIDIYEKRGIKYIMLTDNQWGIITFRYLAQNQIADINIVPVTTPAVQAFVEDQGSFYVANDKTIEYYSDNNELIKKYQLQITDSKIIDLQVAPTLIVARSSNHNIYTYSKQKSEIIYLLSKENVSSNTGIVVSQFFPRIFYIDNTKMRSFTVSSGYIFVSDVANTTTVKIVATSNSVVNCTLNIRIEPIQSNFKVYKKQILNPEGLKFQANQNYKLQLDQYFGGSKLSYNIKNPESAINYKLHYISNYSMPQIQTSDSDEIYLKEIIEINDNSYYYITFTDKFISFYKCSQSAGSSILCEELQSERMTVNPQSSRVYIVKGAYRKSTGNYFFTWAMDNEYKGLKSQIVTIKTISKGLSLRSIISPIRYNSIAINEEYIFMVRKELSYIDVFDNGEFYTITSKDIATDDLEKLGGGFYPRNVYSSFTNSKLIFIKSPISIISAIYLGQGKISVLTVTKVSDTFIPDSKWETIIGTQSILVITDQINEYGILPDSSVQRLHKVDMGNKTISHPITVRYSQEMDTAYVLTTDNSIQYIKMNCPSLESSYYEVKGTGKNDAQDWSVSGSWLLLSDQVYYQYPNPTLQFSVTSGGQSTQSFNLDLIVQSDNQQQSKVQVKTILKSVNFKPFINKSGKQDNGLTLPSTANDTRIQFSVDEYFNGSVSQYDIVCPYCTKGNITLLPPFEKIADNQDVAGYKDIVNIPDGSGVLVVEDNILKVINIENKVEFSYKIQDAIGFCENIGINNVGNDVVVFCSGDSIQQMMLYSRNQKQLTFKQSFDLPEQSYIVNAFQIELYSNNETLYVFVHDKNPMNFQEKNSNVKVFAIEQDQIIFQESINSYDFNTKQIEPIESICIMNNHLFMTISGVGIGYVNVDNWPDEMSLINLKEAEEFSNYIMDDTSFLRVDVLKIEGNVIHTFVSTSNSLHFVVQLKMGETSVAFSKILEKYRKYGPQKIVNWASVDQRVLVMAYYNQSTSVESLAFYRRPKQLTDQIINFYYAKQFTISEALLHPPRSKIIYIGTIESVSNLLFIENRQIPGSDPSLSLYNLTGQFKLLANYDKRGQFNTMKVTASNSLGMSVTQEMSVNFDTDSSGLKWYAVLITICLVGLVVGIAIGLYIRMKGRRGDSKKVSLFTQSQSQEINADV